jgi:hypothetical protein
VTRAVPVPLARLAALAVAALALLPLGRLAADWAAYTRTVGLPLQETPSRGFDGVRWTDDGGAVRAAYVFPRSPAARAGVAAGDQLDAVDFMPVASAAEAERQVERATGAVLTYSLARDGEAREAEVSVVRYPTFLYPLSGALWTAAGWGFAVVTFLHLLAYLTVAPLARRSGRARRARLLIGTALLWVGGNLVRLVWIALVGPPAPGPGNVLFDALTLVALAGWVVYPALLLDAALRAWRAGPLLGAARWVLVVPPVVLGAGVAVATVAGHLGPLPPDAFAVPLLFYVCVYVAAATGLSAGRPAEADRREGHPAPRWSRAGSVGVCALAVAGAALSLSHLGPGPREGELAAAWLVTAFQLFSLLPVGLVSLSSLRYGQFDVLLVRGVATLAVLAVAFLAVAVGSLALDAVLPGGSEPVALGALVVAVLGVAAWAGPVLRDWGQRAFLTERQRARHRLDAFGDRVRFVVDVERLAAEAAEAVGEALGARSAAVFLLAGRGTAGERWTKGTFRPEPPAFTTTDLERIWEKIRAEGRVWSRNEELDESGLGRRDADRLISLRAALAVPVTTGEGEPVGLIVLGRKARRLAVYDTEDVGRLRALAAGLALAVERLGLLDRERALVRQTAEAELVALRAQINPHFLFNALNTVAALIAERPDEAEATVEHLAGLFRDVLAASGEALVPLRDELRLVRRYLAVERARFGDKLEVEVDVAPEAEDVPVPAFAVQTLVENAVKHGVERKRGGGRVTVRARVEGGALAVEVRDTGAGLAVAAVTPGGDGAAPGDTHASAAASASGTPSADAGGAASLDSFYGVGLTNVARRLDQLYGGAARLAVRPAEPGTCATLRLPLHAPAPA